MWQNFFEKKYKWAVPAPELVCIDLADAMNRVRTGRVILGHKKLPGVSDVRGAGIMEIRRGFFRLCRHDGG